MASHNPLNHPLRPLYRAIGALIGIYLIVFGIIGLMVTSGDGLFGKTDDRVLGQGTNLFWSIVSLILGVLVLAVTAMGRNLDTEVDKYLGWGLLVVGSYGLATTRTDANFLNFSIATVVVTYVLGLALIMVALYAKVGPVEEAAEPRPARESTSV
jgi:hypothetical protein